jgi:SAM-dependent methyltransferase
MDRPPKTGYETADLAYIHDAGFGFHARAASEELLTRLRAAGHEEGLVVDVGCGTGILCRIVCDAGYEVLGLDQSTEMLKIARRNAPDALFERASFIDARLPKCVAVTAVGEVLGYSCSTSPDPGAALLAECVQGSSRVRTGRSTRRRVRTRSSEHSTGAASSSGATATSTAGARRCT